MLKISWWRAAGILTVYGLTGCSTPATPPEQIASLQTTAPTAIFTAQHPLTYIVFFGFNKSVLQGEAKAIAARIAHEGKNPEIYRIILKGDTDTTGSRSYNQVLPERRAEALKSELIRLGDQAYGATKTVIADALDGTVFTARPGATFFGSWILNGADALGKEVGYFMAANQADDVCPGSASTSRG